MNMNRRPAEKLVPYMGCNKHSNIWYPEVPYGITYNHEFIEYLEMVDGGKILVTCPSGQKLLPESDQSFFLIWKIELVE